VSSHQPQAGKHRASKARRAPKAALKTSLTLSSMAVVATGFAVGSGSLSLSASGGPAASTTAAVADLGAQAEAAVSGASGADSAQAAEADVAAAGADRAQQPVTRSDTRAAADPLKKDTLSLGARNTMSRTEDLSDESPQDIARALLATFGWSQDQFGCLDSLWMRESHWNVHAANPSGAYGIPQALPGSKMASAGSDWQNNAVTQIKWGLGYIADRYGSPCGAWSHSQGHGWY
jgi:hypothetical protein